MSKSVSHKNRGLSFEQSIQTKLDELDAAGIARISKVPTEWKVIRNGAKIVSAFPVSESRFVDFIGVYNGTAIAIESKETKEKNRFPFSNIKQSQIDFLNSWHQCGGKGYYLIRFSTHNKIYMVHSQKMHECINNIGRKSAPLQWFEDTNNAVEVDEEQMNFIEHIK